MAHLGENIIKCIILMLQRSKIIRSVPSIVFIILFCANKMRNYYIKSIFFLFQVYGARGA